MLLILPENQRRERQKADLIKIICFFVWDNTNKSLEAIGVSEERFNSGANCIQSAYAGIRSVNRSKNNHIIAM